MMVRTVLIFLIPIFFVFPKERKLNTPENALRNMFPGSEIEVKNIIITKEEKKKIEKLARSRLSTRLISIYLVKEGGKVIAYGYVDIHKVRTHTETVLIVISPEGKVLGVEVLAFHEPLEYMADENWLKLFEGKSLRTDKLRLNRDIPNITGSTLTARAITKAVRRALAIWEVLYGGER